MLLTKDKHAAPIDNSRVVVTGGWRGASGEGSGEAQGEVSETRESKPYSLRFQHALFDLPSLTMVLLQVSRLPCSSLG